ncbi:MAG: diguanylate cyclase/phosphodiesterase with GAF sensor [Idiomarinaceae bacterium HL-53]|nr:MAG: diguanylate cyclase/phosphodiesterase with GAF sensor [Idiomarinaceae bacterium HL-53]CUS47562.1 diguanylate cyclase/phosphodiesterase with GAF sensor [Idiomarinaceae bacterium HL-53]
MTHWRVNINMRSSTRANTQSVPAAGGRSSRDTLTVARTDRVAFVLRELFDAKIVVVSLFDGKYLQILSYLGDKVSYLTETFDLYEQALAEDAPFLVRSVENGVGIPLRNNSGIKIGAILVMGCDSWEPKDRQLEAFKMLTESVEELLNSTSRETGTLLEGVEQAILRVQNLFLLSEDMSEIFEQVLNELLKLTDSEYGFIGETLLDEITQEPYIRMGAITNLSWNEASQALYAKVKSEGMYFRELNNLMGAAIISGRAVISNDALNDPRRGYLPPGHPELQRYLGIPIYSGQTLVGLVGLANREYEYSLEMVNALEALSTTIGYLLERYKLLREQKEQHLLLERSANYDVLTNLPNRRKIKELINERICLKQRVAFCFIDLDGFKEINDQHGHCVGDLVLKEIAERLLIATKESGVVSRFGGDEFIVVTNDCADNVIFTRLMNHLSQPIRIKSLSLEVTASMGVAFYPDESSDWDQLIRHANQAMHLAKQQGKNTYTFFDVQKYSLSTTQLQIQGDCKRGLGANEFELYLQPQVNIRTKRVEGFEGLIRWNHPEHGLLGPDYFITQIEESEVAKVLGAFVLNEAVRILQRFERDGHDYYLSINLSPTHFLGDSFHTDLREALAGTSVRLTSRLKLELLETTALNDIQTVEQRLKFCHELGLNLSLDDFGVGYSSLEYFRLLPVNEIKIDRSFIRDMQSPVADERIALSIIKLADSFERKVVAEGVEDQETCRRLQSLGCEIIQGYYFSRPLPEANALDWALSHSNIESKL